MARFRAFRIYLFRLIFSHSVSSKVITGDGIARMCDYQMYPPQLFSSQAVNLKKLLTAKSIFVPGHMADVFLNNFADEITARVLVFGNSDRDYFSLDFPIPASVKTVFLQNSHIQDPRIKALPIGLENIRYGKNGFKWFVRHTASISKANKKILVGPFSPTHSERTAFTDWERCNPLEVTYIDKFLSNSKLARINAEHTFVACPRGNGTDTHRFWETLYRGSVPIVLDNSWSRQIRDLGIPCLLVPSWDYQGVRGMVEQTTLSKFNPKDVKPLWLNYWANLIASYSE